MQIHCEPPPKMTGILPITSTPRPYFCVGHRPSPSKRMRRERREDDRERREDDRVRREDDRERRDDRRPRRQRSSPANTPGNYTQDPPDIRDFHLPPLLSFSITIFAIVLRMRELFGPMLPHDIAYDEASPADPALADMAFTCTYDEGFCGHFSIPNGNGAAADFEKILEQAAVFAFLRKHLLIHPAGTDSRGDDTGEIVIFAPGLNTLHITKEGWLDEQTTPQRLEHFVQVPPPPCPLHAPLHPYTHRPATLDDAAPRSPSAAPFAHRCAQSINARGQLTAGMHAVLHTQPSGHCKRGTGPLWLPATTTTR